MNYALLLACVVGAGAVTGYATAAVFAARRAEGLERLPGRQAFLLRALPGASALLVSLGLALPSFLRHEPLDTRAWPGLTALLLGLAALLLLRDALKRGLPSWPSPPTRWPPTGTPPAVQSHTKCFAPSARAFRASTATATP